MKQRWGLTLQIWRGCDAMTTINIILGVWLLGSILVNIVAFSHIKKLRGLVERLAKAGYIKDRVIHTLYKSKSSLYKQL